MPKRDLVIRFTPAEVAEIVIASVRKKHKDAQIIAQYDAEEDNGSPLMFHTLEVIVELPEGK